MLQVLQQLMEEPLFAPFSLVGGTSLSLRLGHRKSEDIDLFTSELYGSIDWDKLTGYLKDTFPFYETPVKNAIVGMGLSQYVGYSKSESVKVDLFYTDPFIEPFENTDGIRLASLDDIVAMKIDIVQQTARKKDFWDIDGLLEKYTLPEMIELHKKRYPYTHDETLIIQNLTNFSRADNDFDPICLKGKYWELIKMDMIHLKSKYFGKHE